MKATQLAIATAVVTCLTAWSGYALATQPGNNGNGNGGCGNGQQTNGCGSTGGSATGGSANASAGAVGIGVGVGYGQGGAGGSSTAYGGTGGKGGEGGSANVLGSGNSSVKNENSNANIGINGQQQQQSNSSSNSNSVSGYGGSATGNGAGNTTEINVAAPVIPKPAANSAYVGDLPQLPQGSCRLFIGGGGTTRDGSATGMLPIGNDQTCLSTRSLEVMKQINAQVGQSVFGKDDFMFVACQIEGMDKLAACKK